jgi:hypothetical protein
VSYTKPILRERLKRRIMARSRGGNPGEWSARKAQLLAREYEEAGGGYSGPRTQSQRSLSRWTEQEWTTKSGRPSLETGERYLPKAAIEALSTREYAETTRAKRQAKGQFARQPKRIAEKVKVFRNPSTRTPPQFPYDYALYLKQNFPKIWAKGGNIRGNDTFRWWSAYRRGDRSPTVMHWWNVTRPAWIARHFRDHRLPGVIAQIKWGTVGVLGVAGMKRVVEDAIRELEL